MKVWLASLFLCALVVKNSEVSGLVALTASGCGLQDPLSSIRGKEGLHRELRQVQAFPGNRTCVNGGRAWALKRFALLAREEEAWFV